MIIQDSSFLQASLSMSLLSGEDLSFSTLRSNYSKHSMTTLTVRMALKEQMVGSPVSRI